MLSRALGLPHIKVHEVRLPSSPTSSTLSATMSRDSNPTHIHLHSSRHADLFEEFCRPPSSTSHPSLSNPSTNTTFNQNPNATGDSNGMQQIPGSFLPYEEIYLPPHLMPVNPEDEDDVVPDMHAAFGINRALGQGGGAVNGSASGGIGQGETSNRGVAREATWRDLGMEGILDGGGGQGGEVRGGFGAAVVGGMGGGESRQVLNGVGGAGSMGARREGRRTGVLLMR